jgi:hypothetical protein
MERYYTPVVGWIRRTVLQSFWKLEKEIAMRRREDNRVMGRPLINIDNNLIKFDIVSSYGKVLYSCCRLDQLKGFAEFLEVGKGVSNASKRGKTGHEYAFD